MQEYRHLEWAREQGVPVPAAVAAGEFIGPWGRLSSFLAVEELTDMLPLHQAIPLAASQLQADVFRRVEARPGRGDGPPVALPARPPALPQGPVSVPLLRPPRRYPGDSERIRRAARGGRARAGAGGWC